MLRGDRWCEVVRTILGRGARTPRGDLRTENSQREERRQQRMEESGVGFGGGRGSAPIEMRSRPRLGQTWMRRTSFGLRQELHYLQSSGRRLDRMREPLCMRRHDNSLAHLRGHLHICCGRQARWDRCRPGWAVEAPIWAQRGGGESSRLLVCEEDELTKSACLSYIAKSAAVVKEEIWFSRGSLAWRGKNRMG